MCQQKQVSEPEDTIRVQVGIGHSDHGHSSGPRESNTEDLTMVTWNKEAVTVTMALGGLRVQQRYRDVRAFPAIADPGAPSVKGAAVWSAPDYCTWSKASSPIPGQDQLPKPLRSAEEWSGTSSCSGGKHQIQGSEPLAAAERSLLMEHDDGIALFRGSENHPRDESRSSKGVSLEPL